MASDISINAVKATCGVCMSKINETEIFNHQCVQQWYSVTIDTNGKIFYPTNQKGEYLAKVICDNKEQLALINKSSSKFPFKEVIRMNKEAEYNLPTNDDCYISESDLQQSLCSTTLHKSTLEEMLILEVRNRPPLYDYTLPLSVRGRQKIAELWKEISDALHGLLSPEDAKKKWKSLKDTYSKAVAEEKKPSGSARSCSQKTWKHFEAMSFLRSVSRSRNSISNLTVPIESRIRNFFEENSSNNMEQHICSEDELPAKHQAKAKDDINASINRIAEAFCNKDMPVVNLPKLPEIDALDGIFIYIKQRLLKLSQEKQNILLMKFQQDITKEEQN